VVLNGFDLKGEAMKRLAFALAACALLVGDSAAPASQAPQRTETRPYADLHAPPEATTTAAGGLGVVATDRIKAKVVIEYSGGGPCGPLGPDEDTRRTGSAEGGNEVWLLVGVSVGAVAVLGLVGFLLLRRS
jgi:hypothetical protein